MKGLILTHMGKREEGMELVKKGIRLDLTSHICWHVFGLIQKGEKDYEGALKSYTQALKFDKDNLNLLSDAANLQTQLRHFDALQETRELILRLRPNMRKNWVSLAVAYHLNGNLAGAKKILEKFMEIVKNIPDYDFEHSELTLYHIRVLEELGELNEALGKLDDAAKSRVIVDRTAVMETRARLLTKLKNISEAEETWRSLIEKNPDCYDYYREFFSNKGISLENVTDENWSAILQTLKELSDQYRATTPLRLGLAVATGNEFKELARSYLLDGFRRGIPSLFSDVKGLYADSAKQLAIEEVVLALRKDEASAAIANGDASANSEDPSTYLWVLYFLGQHQSHLGRYEEALLVLEEAITHTPTLPELYTCKGRVLKRAGDLVGAVQCIEDARALDLQDRFLNTKSGKYHLRAGLSEEAQVILGLFTKKDAPSPGADLEEMQSLLYLTEEADAQNRLGRLGPALKKYLTIRKVFDDFDHDQYDFHFYAIRRFTMDAYFKLLRWEDKLYNDPALVHAVLEAARIYVRVHDDPKLASSSASARTDAEKKAQKKAKKAAKKSHEDAKKANSSVSNEDKGLDPPTQKDDDPDGIKALTASDGLEQAWTLLKPLAIHPLDRVDICVGIYDVSIRRLKYLQAVKALLAAHALDPNDADLHVRIVDFKSRVSALSNPLPQPIAAAVLSAISTLIPSEVSLETFNSQYLQRYSTSARATLAASEALHLLHAPVNEIESTVFGMLAPENAVDIKTTQKALDFLTTISSSRRDEFREACDKRFPLSTMFKPAEELARLHAEARARRQKIAEGVAAVSEPPKAELVSP
ncbi:NMDA receptor-regulated protein 1a [Fomitiporia mediterranea MF3/22]|uniref:NMDA receptor-regulated protein 1a n=1 Tax=Fomitiporia mediterranea (strain MF3/22) TaxID=694068 RepID=UPI0004408C12|nr:NMDA receptor-regulated protein 1a [Fomitiporia mediterranea MF3/22]EJD05554.1 NMDA receptor-regulated protein 1a [Fomitiporia mediterranea MF3/22]